MWCRGRVGCNVASRRRTYWSDEWKLLLPFTEGRVCLETGFVPNLVWCRISNNMGMCFIWMQTRYGDCARNCKIIEQIKLAELEAAFHQEWALVTTTKKQKQIERLIRSMRRRVHALFNAHGLDARY